MNDQIQPAKSARVLDATDAIAGAVFAAALKAKGNNHGPGKTAEMIARFRRALEESGFCIDGREPEFMVNRQMPVCILASGMDPAACQERVRQMLRAQGHALGLVVDFAAPLMLDGITWVTL